MRPPIGARVAAIRPAREAGLRPIGACGFPVDPALAAAEAPVFWRPEIAPAVVVRLAPAPAASPETLRLIALVAERRAAEDGLHLYLALGPQLFLPAGADPTAPMAAILLLDEDFAVRLAAAARLHGSLTSAARPAVRLPAHRRLRFKRMLRALDGRAADASYRDIAEHILSADVTDSSAWRTAPTRDVAIRLCRAATRLMRGGYLALLRRRS
jgi:hypothetical protein